MRGLPQSTSLRAMECSAHQPRILKPKQLMLKTCFILACGKFYEAQKSVEKGDLYAVRNGSDMDRIMSIGVKARIQILSEEPVPK